MSILSRVSPWNAPDRVEVSVGVDQIFEALSNSRRRAIVRALVEDYDGESTTSDLAEHVAVLETPVEVCTPSDLNSRTRKSVYVAVYQDHLPKLDSLGIVDNDHPQVYANAQTHAAYDALDSVESVVGGESDA